MAINYYLGKARIGSEEPENIPHDDLLEGLLPSSGLGFLVGSPGTGKSFLALYLGACLATGCSFIHRKHETVQENQNIGFPIKKSAVLMLVGERDNKLHKRIHALEASLKENNLFNINGDKLPIIILPIRAAPYWDCFPVLKFQFKEQRELLQNLGYDIRLVIIDTLPSVFAVSNENDNATMARLCAHVREFAEKMNSFVLMVTHPTIAKSGKGFYLSKKPRGAGSQEGAADIIWYLGDTKEKNIKFLSVEKGSEGYCEGHKFYFDLIEKEKSAVLIPTDYTVYKEAQKAKDKIALGDNDLQILKAINSTCLKTPILNHGSEEYLELKWPVISEKSLWEEIKEIHNDTAQNTLRNRMKRGIERLKENEYIESWDYEKNSYLALLLPWQKLAAKLNLDN